MEVVAICSENHI